MFTPGDLILDQTYRIDGEVGRGAFGVVYRATHLTLNVARAVKVLRSADDGVGSTVYTDYRNRFRLEAQLAARLTHPQVIQVYDFQERDGVLFCIMEFAPGGSLADLLAKAGPLPVERTVQILLDAAAGLEALHDQLDAVHRDVKPANLLLNHQGRVKVADLGLAQVGGLGLSGRSAFGSMALPHPGTPNYNSPEHGNGGEPLAPTADIYGLGCVAFELLTGRVWKLAQRKARRPGDLRADTPPWLDAVVVRMVCQAPGLTVDDGGDPAKRYVDMSAVQAALHTGMEQARHEAAARAAEEKRQKEAAEQERQRIAAEQAAAARAAEEKRQKEAAEQERQRIAAEQARKEAAARAAVEKRRQEAAEQERHEAAAKAAAEKRQQAASAAAAHTAEQERQRALTAEQTRQEASARAEEEKRHQGADKVARATEPEHKSTAVQVMQEKGQWAAADGQSQATTVPPAPIASAAWPAWLTIITVVVGFAGLLLVYQSLQKLHPESIAQGVMSKLPTVFGSEGLSTSQSFAFTVVPLGTVNPIRINNCITTKCIELAATIDEDSVLMAQPDPAQLDSVHLLGDDLTFWLTVEPANGVVAILDAKSGAFEYQPHANFFGEDFFTLDAVDSPRVAASMLVSVTVTPVNDNPQVEAPDVYNASEDAEVLLPLAVSDADDDELTVHATDLPPGLVLVGSSVVGVVETGASADSPYASTINAVDSKGATSTATIIWNIAPAHSDVSLPAYTSSVPVLDAVSIAQIGAVSPGVDGFEGYTWAAPEDFGDCPVVNGALTPRATDQNLSLFAEATSMVIGNGPFLKMTLDVPVAGEYALYICGCAPTYVSNEQVSPALANDSVYAVVNGATLFSDSGLAVPMAGFAESPDFTWRNTWSDEWTGEMGSARFTVDVAGPQSVELSMSEDGLLVYSTMLVPVDATLEQLLPNGASCTSLAMLPPSQDTQ